MEKLLNNKVAVVTGGAKGIGKEVCRIFAREGATVLLFDIDEKKLIKTTLELKDISSNVQEYIVDISSSASIDIVIKKIMDSYKKIDILVNSAGIFETNKLLDTTDKVFDKVLDINLKGTLYCCRAIAEKMIQKKYGKIVNISSLAGKTKSIIAGISYSVSKAGIIGLTRMIAAELAEYNINVNAVAPSYIETDMLSSLNKSEKEKIIKAIPLKRITTIEDVANLILFLSSNLSKNITGEVININGGTFMD